MSPASACFSSSSRSMRSIKDFRRSPAIPPISGMDPPLPSTPHPRGAADDSRGLLRTQGGGNRPPFGSVLLLGSGEGGLLLGAGLLLVLFAPFVIGHAVDDLARLRVAQRHA